MDCVTECPDTAILGKVLSESVLEQKLSTIADERLSNPALVLGEHEFADRTLGPLADGEQHAELVRTLDAYLRLHGSLNAVARDLYLHRNTVRQRLRRITKLTGADLKNADSRLALQLALLGRSALERLAS